MLWFRLDRPDTAPPPTIAYVSNRDVAVTIARDAYVQAGLLIPKGTFAAVRDAGLTAFRERFATAVPSLAASVARLPGWDDVKLLTVQIAAARRWHRPGFLAIGDAVHVMSPAFGVGVNYAIQDAVATARILGPALRAGAPVDPLLPRVARRRRAPARAMQAIQRAFHAAMTRPGRGILPPARVLRRVLPVVGVVTRPVLGRLVGRGIRPEKLG